MPMPEPQGVEHVDPATAERLINEGSVHVLDVRTPEEYERLGHVPGAMLLPVDLVVSAPAVLPKDGRPVLVYCEHGIRSLHAAEVLLGAGFPRVLNMVGGMSCWHGARDWTAGRIAGPSSWLLQNADLLPRGGRALDVACGRGRHALLLAAAGYQVTALDRAQDAIGELQDTASRLGLPLDARVEDLEAGNLDFGHDLYSLIVIFHYLHRPLFPALVRALAPGGLLLYETFTVDQAARGRPTNPDFLLKHGELVELVKPLGVLRKREGEFEDRMVAAVAARRV